MIGLNNSFNIALFVPKSGAALSGYIAISLIIGMSVIFILTKVPKRYRKPIVIGITFIMGWFYFLEFMLPGRPQTAPIRNKLTAAEQHLRLAEHELTVIANRGKDSQPQTWRNATALKSIDAAFVDLRSAQTGIDKLTPVIQRRYDAEAAKAEASAKAQHMTDKMLQRDSDTGKIINQATADLSKQLSDLGECSKKIAQVSDSLKGIQDGLKSSHPDMTALAASVTDAADTTDLARTGISDNSLTPYKSVIGNVSSVIGAFALGLGAFSLLSIHGKAIVRRRPGRINSVAFYAAIIAITLFGLLSKYLHVDTPAQKLATSLYSVLFDGGLTALQATMFSLVAFYIVSAAYRAFRVRSGEAALMMVAAFLVMLGMVPFGIWLTSWIGSDSLLAPLKLENIRAWIMAYPNTAAQRGMAFGIGVGGLAMALRIWLSLERGSYFDKQM